MKKSVAMCTYNGEKFIEEQINSILNQTEKVNEIVVCDDGSTDKTIQILNNYLKNYPDLFKIYINEINLRSVKNFEKAIKLCTGDIIFLSDQDDIWVDKKVEVYMNYFIQNSDIEVIASNGYCIDEKGSVHEKYAIWDLPQFLKEEKIIFDYFELISFLGNITTGASMALKKEILTKIVPFPIIENFHHDEWIALIASKSKSFELLNEKYFYYRIHDNQQVGGVFYKKNENVKKELTDFANYNSSNLSFNIFKKRLKKIVAFYNLIGNLQKLNIKEFDFEKIKKNTLNKYKITKNLFKIKYPFRYFILNNMDKIFNKRKIKYESN